MGLVQAAVLAEVGYEICCVDIDEHKVEQLRQGNLPIFEPGLSQLVADNLKSGRLHFTTDAKHGIEHGEMLFIAVGTPPHEDGSADLSHVLGVSDDVATHMTGVKTIVVKSTVPVGTCDKISQRIADRLAARGAPELEFHIVSNPEFLKEGSAVSDCIKPDRIILGVHNREAEQVMRDLYAPFNRNHEKIIVMDVRSAELTKYAANSMLATKISLMNEIANLADALGADIEHIRRGIGSDPRIGYHFIYAGIGYGGSCFPKDLQALIRTAQEIGFEPKVLHAVEERNRAQKSFLLTKIFEHFGDDLSGKTFALWGLAFKPNTDDMRAAPARTIMEGLWAAGANVQAYDPEAMDECRRLYGDRSDLVLCADRETAVEGADSLILATEWKEFQAPDFAKLKSTLTQPVIFDGRNFYDPQTAACNGLTVYGVGRNSNRR